MTRSQLNKSVFVASYISPLLRRVDPAITSVEYHVIDGTDAEEVVIFRDDVSNTINVTGDSIAALARDVIFEFYVKIYKF